jgi:hypothetical protein
MGLSGCDGTDPGNAAVCRQLLYKTPHMKKEGKQEMDHSKETKTEEDAGEVRAL